MDERTDSELDRDILRTVDRFIEEFLEPRAAAIDASDAYPRDLHDLAGELGLFGLAVPEAYGGVKVGLRTRLAVIERVCRSSASFGVLLSAWPDGLAPLNRYGSEALKQRLLPGIATGELIPAFALSEPGAGSDAAAITTTREARRRRLRPQRNEDVVHAREHRRRPHGVRQDRPGRRPPRNHRVPGGEGNPGFRGGPRREPRRASRLPAVHGPVRRRARAGRASHRRGGRRIPDRDGGTRRGPAELLGPGPRRRLARHPRSHLARRRAHRLRPADHRLPGGALPAGGAVHRVRRGPRAVASGHRRVRGRPDPKVRGSSGRWPRTHAPPSR